MTRICCGLGALMATVSTLLALEVARTQEGRDSGGLYTEAGGKQSCLLYINRAKKQATVYVVGEDGKTLSPIPTKAIEVQIKVMAQIITLKAISRESDPPEKSTRFEGRENVFGTETKYEDIELRIRVKGQPVRVFTYKD